MVIPCQNEAGHTCESLEGTTALDASNAKVTVGCPHSHPWLDLDLNKKKERSLKRIQTSTFSWTTLAKCVVVDTVIPQFRVCPRLCRFGGWTNHPKERVPSARAAPILPGGIFHHVLRHTFARGHIEVEHLQRQNWGDSNHPNQPRFVSVIGTEFDQFDKYIALSLYHNIL